MILTPDKIYWNSWTKEAVRVKVETNVEYNFHVNVNVVPVDTQRSLIRAAGYVTSSHNLVEMTPLLEELL